MNKITGVILNNEDMSILKRNHITVSPLIRELIKAYIMEKNLK